MFSKGECVVALEALEAAGILTSAQLDKFPELDQLHQFANALLLVQQAKAELKTNLNRSFCHVLDRTTELLKGK
jgi:hypothetical protein